MALFLGVYPSRQQYRLPGEEEAGEVTNSLAEVLGNRGCAVLGYDVPDQTRADAVVLINGKVVESVDLVEVPDDEDSTLWRVDHDVRSGHRLMTAMAGGEHTTAEAKPTRDGDSTIHLGVVVTPALDERVVEGNRRTCRRIATDASSEVPRVSR